MSNTFTYKGLELQQHNKGPTLYLARVTARELLKWADVPRKRADIKAGYQRQLNESRLSDIKQFLEISSDNLMPGAVLVSLRDEKTEIDKTNDGFVNISIEYDSDNTLSGDSVHALIDKTINRLYGRLGSKEKQFADGGLDIDIEDLEEGSPLPTSYLAELTRELKEARDEYDGLDKEDKRSITRYVINMAKPGRILDGQHRVFGAKDIIDRDIYFPVVLMPGLDDSEQVFHFFVVNNKAKPLDPVELRSTISTSLSDEEIDELYDRLQDAGIEAEEAKLTYRMNRNPNSPFQGLIDFKYDDERSFIRENVANSLVLKFVKPPSRFSPLYEGVDQWGNDPKFDYRLSMFFTLWKSVREAYPNAWAEGVDNKGGQLFYKVSMIKLQEKVMENLKPMNVLEQANTGNPVFASRDKLSKLAGIVLDQLPERFWLEEWQEKVSDSGDFREFLKEQIQKAMDGADIGRLKLFRKTG